MKTHFYNQQFSQLHHGSSHAIFYPEFLYSKFPEVRDQSYFCRPNEWPPIKVMGTKDSHLTPFLLTKILIGGKTGTALDISLQVYLQFLTLQNIARFVD